MLGENKLHDWKKPEQYLQFFSRALSRMPRLNEFSDVVLSRFTLSPLDYLNGSITHTTGRLTNTIV